MKNKRLILTIGVVIAVALIATMVILLVKNTTPEEQGKDPDFLINSSIQESNLEISEFETEEQLDNSLPLYYIEDITNVSVVEEFIDTLGFEYERNKAVVENHFTWGDEDTEAFFNYSTEDNILDIMIREDIRSVVKLTRDNAETVVNSYLNSLGLEYEYKLNKMVPSGEDTILYLSRMLEGYPIETPNTYGATDHLMFSERGNLVYAQLLFAKFTNKLNYNVPLIDVDDLMKVINEEEYPKEIRVDDVDFIEGSENVETSYIEGEFSSEVVDIIDTVSDCNPMDISIVYYYPRQTGIYLLPAYKLNCVSTATYEETEYSISSIVYTNAVSPEYISSE